MAYKTLVMQELLVDLTYCVYDGVLLCERHYAERSVKKIRERQTN